MSLNNNERSQIRNLLQMPQWGAIEHVKNELCDKIKYDSKLRDTEWETLKTTVFDEGQVEGINRFINELFNQAKQ